MLASFSYRRDGVHPGLKETSPTSSPRSCPAPPCEEYLRQGRPQPGRLAELIAKITQMDADLPQWTAEAVRGLTAPTMLIIGDSDIVHPEHAVKIFRLLGGGVIGDLAGLPRRAWPSSPAPWSPTSPWSRRPTGSPRWSATSSTPRPAEDLSRGGAAARQVGSPAPWPGWRTWPSRSCSACVRRGRLRDRRPLVEAVTAGSFLGLVLAPIGVGVGGSGPISRTWHGGSGPFACLARWVGGSAPCTRLAPTDQLNPSVPITMWAR